MDFSLTLLNITVPVTIDCSLPNATLYITILQTYIITNKPTLYDETLHLAATVTLIPADVGPSHAMQNFQPTA